MSTLFPAILEKRYANFPRRYLVEYHVDGRGKHPDAKGRCVTLANAKKRAVSSIEVWGIHNVRIFDSRIGQYLFTFKKSEHGILRHEGYVR